MSQTLYARFDDYKMAEKAVGALLDHGMEKDDVSLLANRTADNEDPAKHEGHAKAGITTTTGADAGLGAAKGAGVGVVVGALGALASLMIPGFGLVIGGGALATALATAAVGIGIGPTGTAQALETADIALMQDDLRRLPFAVRLSQATMRTVWANIALSLSIKGVFLLLVLAGVGTMWLAVLADVGTSLLVTANGLRLLYREA